MALIKHSLAGWGGKTLCVVGVVLTLGCTPLKEEYTTPRYQVGQIWDVKQHKIVSFAEFTSALLKADVIYLGEAHYTPPHIDAALRILNALVHAHKRPVLAMEMFSWDAQETLNQYIQNGKTLGEDEFLQAVHWKENWGGTFSPYKRLVTFAHAHAIPLYALNPPRSLIRRVASQGFARVQQDSLFQGWKLAGAKLPHDPAYRAVIFDQIIRCHPHLKPEVYEHLYEASVVRDEGMAKVIADYLAHRQAPNRPLVSYTGGGHIQYGLPVPKRVSRRYGKPLHQITVYLHAFDPKQADEVTTLLADRIANYLWLTPVGPQGPSPRCGA
ncbi:MAG: hypothetical protein D6704_03090 [Nitrospirae bacterium]|nr:MAG: hypothetical protein D6704_03090 [Nitrospirota bacterium]